MEENKRKKRQCRHRPAPRQSRRKPQPALSNKLWLHRKRSGLGQKQLARLMGLKSVTLISLYERGKKLPNLVNALKLELIFSTASRFLFPELWAQLHGELIKRQERSFRV